MVMKNPEAAVIAAIAVIAIVAFHMDANKTDLNPKPTVAINTKAKLPAQMPSETPVPTGSTEPEETPPPVTLYDVPLEAELQLHIMALTRRSYSPCAIRNQLTILPASATMERPLV